MKEHVCKCEPDVLKERAALSQNKELAAYIADCANCRETLKMADWMQDFAAISIPLTVPKPGFIWWKAQIIERQKKAERAIYPMIWTQMTAAILTISVVVWLLIKNQTQFAPTWKALSGSLELVGMPLLLVLTCAAFIYFVTAYKRREQRRAAEKNNF